MHPTALPWGPGQPRTTLGAHKRWRAGEQPGLYVCLVARYGVGVPSGHRLATPAGRRLCGCSPVDDLRAVRGAAGAQHGQVRDRLRCVTALTTDARPARTACRGTRHPPRQRLPAARANGAESGVDKGVKPAAFIAPRGGLSVVGHAACDHLTPRRSQQSDTARNPLLLSVLMLADAVASVCSRVAVSLCCHRGIARK